MVWLVFWFVFYEVPEKSKRISPSELAFIDSDRDEDHAEGHIPISWGQLLSRPEAWSFIVAKAITDPVWWFFLTWTPDYFNKSRHLDIKGSAIYLVSIYGIVTVLSIIGGWAPGVLIQRGWSVTAARKLCLFIFALAVTPMFLTTHVGNWGAVLILGVAASAHQAWSANIYSTVSDMFPKRAVATLTGIGGTAGSGTGIFAPIAVGWLIDHFNGNATAAYAILFGIISFMYVIAFVLQHLLAPRFEQVTGLARAPQRLPVV
jgi:ACS family hexuronate transporter-like MFS transporter